MTSDNKFSRRFVLILAVVCLTCIGIVSHHFNSSGFEENSFGLRSLIEVSSISRGPGDRSAIPPIQDPNSGSIFSSLSSWFGSSTTPSTSVTPSTEAAPVAQAVSTEAVTTSTAVVPTSNALASTTNTTTPFTLSREQCKAQYGERSYLPEDRKKLPPVLYTFPGAGNTWCRLLIEYATGVFSGSVYNDKSLLESLPGEFTCNQQVSVIKVHPHTHPFEGLRTGFFQSDAHKCPRGQVGKIKRAIMVIRDPFDSIWSEFQRRMTRSHVGGILKADFDWHQWQANAAALSHLSNLMWAVEHAGIEKHFPPYDYLYVKYEDLKNKTTRVDTLERIARFLDISIIEKERLECAFALADKRDTHRVVDKYNTMSKEEAYVKPLVCRMWALFGKHAAKHGYTVWKNMDCTPGPDTTEGAYPPIPRINVGPQGEYNYKWVKPGGKLLDFGGHPPNQPGAGQHKRPGGGGGGGGNGQRGNKPPKQGGAGGNGANPIAAATAVNPAAAQIQQPQLQQAQAQLPQQPQAAPQTEIEALAAAARKSFLEQKRQQLKQGKAGGKGGGKNTNTGGMTIQEASRRESVIAAVGADKPAWQ